MSPEKFSERPELPKGPTDSLKGKIDQNPLNNSLNAIQALEEIEQFQPFTHPDPDQLQKIIQEQLQQDITNGDSRGYGYNFKSEFTKYIEILTKTIKKIRNNQHQDIIKVEGDDEVEKKIYQVGQTNLEQLNELKQIVYRMIVQDGKIPKNNPFYADLDHAYNDLEFTLKSSPR